jgi:hypothetical protein
MEKLLSMQGLKVRVRMLDIAVISTVTIGK